MITCNFKSISLACLLAASAFVPTYATAASPLIVSEVAPWASGNSSYAADWFELTNTGASAINISGWKIDDNSNSFAVSVALSGITSIGAGESVIFLDNTGNTVSNATLNNRFKAAWFGLDSPASPQIGNYAGTGVGLSTAGDAVNIYNGSGTLITNISFGASTTGVSFDNAAGLNGTVSQLSVAGVNGAFVAFDGTATGSPGSIAAVPEAQTYAMMLAGLMGLALVRRARG